MTPGIQYDALVVGAGFAGLYMMHRLRGLGMSAIGFEAGEDVGGTWYWNRYPGARCDVESMQYSYAFDDGLQQDWRWSEVFASQPEILRYAQHVAERFDLRRSFRFNTRVASAAFDEAGHRWTVLTDTGDTVSARFCIMATGCLSAGRLPEVAGIETFRGLSYHTGSWPHGGVDFTGQRVGVIGTGSSGIQAVPVIAEQAHTLHVFQRTPNFSLPARNGPMPVELEAAWKAEYPQRRTRARATKTGTVYDFGDKSAMDVPDAEREREYMSRWQRGGINFMAAYNDISINAASNETAAAFVRARIRELVHDPDTAEALTPRDYPIGTKRICVDSGYFETFNRPNVTLVDLRRSPLAAVIPAGVRTTSAEYELDSIVFATGFDAITGALARIAVTGRGGAALADKWAAGPRTYLGLMTAGFPNLFLITGPGSPSVLSNMIFSIEQHVEWIADCLAHLRRRDAEAIEAELDAEDAWVAHVNEVAHRTLYPRAASWYMGANVQGKPRVFMPYIGGVDAYRRRCEEVAAAGYEGFRVAMPAARQFAAAGE